MVAPTAIWEFLISAFSPSAQQFEKPASGTDGEYLFDLVTLVPDQETNHSIYDSGDAVAQTERAYPKSQHDP
jgi:hypothetical protein